MKKNSKDTHHPIGCTRGGKRQEGRVISLLLLLLYMRKMQELSVIIQPMEPPKLFFYINSPSLIFGYEPK
jgi:hypothetical protein